MIAGDIQQQELPPSHGSTSQAPLCDTSQHLSTYQPEQMTHAGPQVPNSSKLQKNSASSGNTTTKARYSAKTRGTTLGRSVQQHTTRGTHQHPTSPVQLQINLGFGLQVLPTQHNHFWVSGSGFANDAGCHQTSACRLVLSIGPCVPISHVGLLLVNHHTFFSYQHFWDWPMGPWARSGSGRGPHRLYVAAGQLNW